jgi:uncharacterized repeat protein (TIGR01451 family)
MFGTWWRGRSRRPSSRPVGGQRSAWRRRLPLSVEALEERILLDGGVPAALVVGRTLSAYTVPDVQNNQLTITYTVYNEQGHPLNGVLLTDTLDTGVTFQSASQLPDQSGQNLAWSLGTINGFDRASVTLTVGLVNPIPLQLDVGAQAFATLDAGAVSNATPAASLRQGSVDPNLLASTPDANTNDPFVQEKAAELNYDPQQIFNYLHNDIGYNSYTGSLRGARGTLWSSAGNALDVANLGVALMRASGIPAQYEAGTLSQSQAQQLILSMFPASFQTVGYIPPGTPTADPANDPQLLSETESHYWFQFDAGSGMKDADPLLAGAQVGQTFTTSTGTFAEVSDTLREKTEVTLTAEIYHQGSAILLGGDGLSDTVVLDQTFNDVDLVGRPLTIGNFVSSSGVGLTFGELTNTYSPYLQLGDEAFPDPSQDQIIHGTDYQEVLTNFPLGNQILTGLFLDVTLSGPSGSLTTYERALLDRIGYAARQGLERSNISEDPNGAPALSNFDIFTLNVLAGLNNPTYPGQSSTQLAQLQTQLSQITAATNPSPAQLTSVLTQSAIELTRALGDAVMTASDASTSRLAGDSLVRAYFDRPRLILVSHRLTIDTSAQTAKDAFTIDLRRDSLRALSFPGQTVSNFRSFNAIRGVAESAIEQNVPALLLSAQQPPLQSVSAVSVFQAALAQRIGLAAITKNNLATLDTLGVSADALARITQAILEGEAVIVPVQPVSLNGVSTTAWYEIDPVTGEAIGVTQDGGHASVETALSELVAYGERAIQLARAYQTAFLISVAVNVLLIAVIGGLLAFRSPPPFLLTDQHFLSTATTAQVAGLSGFSNQFTALLENVVGAPLPAAANVVPLSNPIPTVPFESNQPSTDVPLPARLTAGAVTATVQTPSATLSGALSASWTAQDTSSFVATALSAPGASVKDANGNAVGSGAVTLDVPAGLPVAASGNLTYSVSGQGSLSAYAQATPLLGVSGDWTSYTATLSGNATLQLTADALQLNGTTLPAGIYTISSTSASLTGSGLNSSPSFSGAVTIQATGANVQLGTGSGTASVGGTAQSPNNGFTLDGFTGTATVTAGTGTAAVALNGTAANVLAVAGNPSALTTDQNHSVSFQLGVLTSESATYHSDINAPSGWSASIDASGAVTLTPPPGLQSGTYPITFTTSPLSKPGFVAQGVVNVTITPTQPGITLAIAPDPSLTVPFAGAQLPTAFRATIHNNGPAADTFNLPPPTPPTGFTFLSSATSVTIPAGQTGIVGIYLQPSGSQLPAPGTPASFSVTATSASNPAITQTVNQSFTVPAVDGVTVAGSPVQVTSTPDTPTIVTLTFVNVGNVSENVTLAPTTPTDLTVSGLTLMTVAAGKTATETITLTPDASAALNATLAATITATYGPTSAPLTASTEVDVLVRSPQTVAVSQAAVAATQGNNTDLATNLSELGDTFAQLQATPTDAGSSGRAQFLLGNLSDLLSADPGLASFVSQLQPLQAAASAHDTAGLLALVPAFFNSLSSTLAVEATQQFTVSLAPNEVDLQPGQGQDFSVQLANTGSDQVALTLGTAGLPGGVTARFGKTQVTLAPGKSDTVPLTLSQTLVSSKIFTLDVTAAASVAQHTATAVVAVRPAAADVVSVTATPTTIQAGTPVAVSAEVFNTANAARSVLAHVDVLDGTNAVVNSLPDVPVTLTPGTAAVTLNVGQVATTGLVNGAYAVRVSLRTTDGVPLPGHSSQAPFLVGLPISATVSASATSLLPGTSTVTTTITVTPTGGGTGPGGPNVAPAGGGSPSSNPPSGGAGPGPLISPLISGDNVQWVAAASGNWNVAANWLDITTNTHHVPTPSDAVTIDVPGVTVTVASGNQTGLSVHVASGSTLALAGGNLTLGADSEIDGGLTLSSTTLTLGGTLTLRGTTQWNASAFINLAGHTLDNLGSMTLALTGGSGHRLQSSNGNQLIPGGTLVNSGTIVQQGIDLSLSNGVAIIHNTAQGTYELTDDATISTHGSLVNDGVIRKTGGTGTGTLNGILFSNTGGTLEVDSGTLSLDAAGGGTSTGGTFIVAQDATLDLTGGSTGNTFTGTYTGSGAGTVLLSGGGTLNIGTGGATFNFPAGLFQWNAGAFDSKINVQGNTLTNAGTIIVGSATSSRNVFLQSRDSSGNLLANGTLLNTGTIVQQGPGALNLADTATVKNQGTYQFTGDGSILNNSGALFAAFANAGTLVKTGGTGTSNVTAILNNTGTIVAQSGTLTLGSGTYASNQISGDRLTGGTWVAQGGATLALGRAITTSQANLTLDGAGSTITGVQGLAVNTGTLTVTNGARFSTSASLDNRGTLALGPAGSAAVAGSFTQEAAGTLDVQLGGTPAGGQFGTLAVTKSTTLGGLLRGELVGGYVPAAGDSFPVVTSAGSSGAFAAVALPATATVAFGAAVNPNGVVLAAQAATATPTTTTVTSSLPGGATYGQPVTFTATVAAGSGTPTGAVLFQVDGVNVGGPVTLTAGSASLPLTLAVGHHVVAAIYASDTAQFAGSGPSTPLSQAVNPGTPAPAANVSLFFTQFGTGSAGGLSQAAIGYDGSSLTLGTPTSIDPTLSGDGLIFLPNGNLLVGGPSVSEVDPTTGAVLGTINTPGDHLTLDPSGTRVWTSDQGSPGIAGHTGPLVEIPLAPFGTSITHALHGDDGGLTHLAFIPDGTVYYTDSTPQGGGSFGVIDLSTFTTKRLVSHLPAAHGLSYDPYTGDLIMVGASSVTQFDPRTQTIVSERDFPNQAFVLDQGAVDGKGHLYAADNTGHLIFIDYSATGLIGDARDFVTTPFVATDLDDVAPLSGVGSPGIPVTVNHLLPASGYAVDAASVHPAGAVSSSAVAWHGQVPAGSTAPLTFQLTGQVTNLASGEVRQISQGTTVTAVVGAPGGSVLAVPIQLPPVVVTADHIISLAPSAQSAERGASVAYIVKLTNPLPTGQTYTLSVDGLAGMTTNLAASVTVNPGQTASVPLQVTVPTGAIPGTQAFEVLAQTAQGAADSVEGQLTVLAGVVLPSLAVNLTLTPTQAMAGQGNPARYTLTVRNTGDATDTYTLSGSFPTGFTGRFSTTTITVPPGMSNFRDVQLTLTPAAGTAAGRDPFTITATSATQGSVTAPASGNVDVSGNGVGVTLNPPAGAPGSGFQLTVTNTGQATDTFDLKLAGPAALVSSLGMPKVTLAPGASQIVPITTGAVNFADPGALPLMGVATSEANTAVQASASAALTIPGTTGMTAEFSPATQVLPVPGTSSFLLLVHNTGNTEDSYTATITGTNGPVRASLDGLNGQPTQTIPLFRLPGLSTGAILLNADLAHTGQGTVTVRVQSQSDPSMVAAPTATVSAAPVVVAGAPGTVQFSAASYSAAEESGAATITLTRTGGSSGAVSVVVNTADGSALSGQDYVPVSQVVSWADGDASPKTVTIPLNDDNLPGERNETVRLALGNPGGGASVGSQGSAVLTRVEAPEPAPPPTLSLTRAVEHSVLVLTLAGAGFTKRSVVVLRGHVKGGAFTIRLKTKFLSSTRVQARVPKFLPSPFGGSTVEENNDLTFSVQTPGGVETASQRFLVLEEVRPHSAGTTREQAAVVAYEALHEGHESQLKDIPKSFLKQFFATFGGHQGR